MKDIKIVFIVVLLAIVSLHAVTKTSQEVFDKWIQWQQVCEDCSLVKKPTQLTAEWWGNVQTRYNKYNTMLQPCAYVLCDMTAKSINGQSIAPSISFQAKSSFNTIYTWLDNDMDSFLQYMLAHKFIDPAVNDYESKDDINNVILKYRRLFKLFLSDSDKHIQLKHFIALANRMFEYSFGLQTFPCFYQLLQDPTKHQLTRLLYSVMWFYLVGEGWKHWSEQCLRDIEREAKQGKEIVYIAGGNDIYQLLGRGIYRIRIIDPILPSQPAYYAEGWDWLVQGNGIGDILKFDNGRKKLLLKRSAYQEHGTFNASLSTGQSAALPLSTTTWTVYERNKKVGSVIFERRFCKPSDFVINSKKQSLLISFNEMYFVALPDDMHGWGIGAERLPENLLLHVKQLRKPVSKQVMANIRQGEYSPFMFILLGSCAT